MYSLARAGKQGAWILCREAMIGASSREPIRLKPIHWKLQLDQTNTSMRVPSRPAAAHALTSNGPVKFTDSVTGWLFAVNTHTAGTRLYSLLRAETDVSRRGFAAWGTHPNTYRSVLQRW